MESSTEITSDQEDQIKHTGKEEEKTGQNYVRFIHFTLALMMQLLWL